MVKGKYAASALKTHTELWQNNDRYRQAKAFIERPSSRLVPRETAYLLCLQREHLRSLTSYIMGHGPFRYSLYVRGLFNSPTCSCGEGDDTAMHVLTQCPRFARTRLAIWGNPQPDAHTVINGGLRSLHRFTCHVADSFKRVIALDP